MKINKNLIFKIILAIILVVICLIMIYIGRGHTLYLDNKSIEVNGNMIEAPYRIKVYVKGKEVADLNDGDRGMCIWIGPNAHLDLEITEVKGGDKKNISYNVPMPWEYDGVVINLVGLMNGAEYDNYISEFIPLGINTSDENEEVNIDEIGDLSFGE